MDRQLEGRAAEFFQRQKYGEAADVYTQCLEVAKEQNDRVNLLLNRASCYLKQGKFSEAQADCDEILEEDVRNEKALWKKVKVLCFQGRFQDAHLLTTNWLEIDPENLLAQKELRRLEIVMTALKDQDGEDEAPVNGPVVISEGKVITEIRPAPEGKEETPQSSPTSNPTQNLPASLSFSTKIPVPETNDAEKDEGTSVDLSPETDSSVIQKETDDPTTEREINGLAMDSDTDVSSMSPETSNPAMENETDGTAMERKMDHPTTERITDSFAVERKTDSPTMGRIADSTAMENEKDGPAMQKETSDLAVEKETENRSGGNNPGIASELEECQNSLITDSPVEEPVTCWNHRPPPRGLTSDEYSLCARFQDIGRCTFGENCTQAHSVEELSEWKERFDQRRHQLQKARENCGQGSNSIEQLQEKLLCAENTETVLTENLDVAKVHCNSVLKVDMSSKKCSHAWLFTVTSRVPLHRVLLLDDTYRSYFCISSVSKGPKKVQKHQNIDANCQEWINPDQTDLSSNENVYRIKVMFRADIYGTFRQTLVFDYGSLPVLGQLVQVDSAPPAEANRLSRELILTAGNRWDVNSVNLVEFKPAPFKQSEMEEKLKSMYTCPHPEKFNLSRALFNSLSKENYRRRMHELLLIEEMEQFGSIARYNVKATLQLENRFVLIPGTLTARMKMEDDLSEDSVHGRLILQNCQTAWLMADTPDQSEATNTVYEVLIEDKGKNFVFLRLSAECVSGLNLTSDEEFKAQVQFQLNRLPMCEMHYGVDNIPTLDLVFPDLSTPPSIPWTPDRQWTNIDSKLNAKQKEAVIAITAPLSLTLPPILICGPYGTGKTYTLAQAAKLVLKEKGTRILICTHSNSAADLYIKNFLHPYVLDGHEEATPLRIYYRYRWTQKVPECVQRYCLPGEAGVGENFRLPTLADLEKHRVVITTLSTSRYLCHLDIKGVFFTHIFLDEAAQSMECETLLPLTLAGEKTRIVLAGDHMQLSPEVCSAFVKERGLHRSLLERLYDLYTPDFPCKILLCENYRSHKAIVQLTSDLFYDSKLVASGKQPAHDTFYPLTFFTAKGEEVQHVNSTGFYNMAEICEIVDRVEELLKTWPSDWGELCESSIGIVTPYYDQVKSIRSELKKRKLFRVSVERVLNVQGKQFRAIFLSVVRTRLTCSTDSAMEELLDYGFLSNVKLLNTAITRAQSLVAVVGDPVSLCAVGRCRKVWEQFIKFCNTNKSLHGTTWEQLRAQLDGLEMKRTYVLNPNAPEFVPNRLRHGTHHLTPDFYGYNSYSYMYGYRPTQPGYNPGYQAQMMYPYLPLPPYGPGLTMYPNPWMIPQRLFKHPSSARGGKGHRLSPVPRAFGQTNQSPPSQRMGSRGASPSDGVGPPADAETPSQTLPPKSKTKIGTNRFPNRHASNGSLPFYARGGYQHLLPHAAQIPYGMFIPDDARFYMLHGGLPAHFGFLPGGPMPYYMPRYLPPFPSASYSGHMGYHNQPVTEDHRLSPNSSNRSTPGSQSSESRPASSADLLTSSPSSSPNSFQQIQLLPNVKHAPAHLMNPECPVPDRRNSPIPGVSRDQSPSRVITMSPSGKGAGPVPRGTLGNSERTKTGSRAFTGPSPHSQHGKSTKPGSERVQPLRPLASVGGVQQVPLGCQYSEEPQTPTQIDDLMKMIEENSQDSPRKHLTHGHPLEEKYFTTESKGSSRLTSSCSPPQVQYTDRPITPVTNTPHGKDLRLNISLAISNQRPNLNQSSPSPQSSKGDTVNSPPNKLPLPDKPTYAGVLRRPPPSPQPQTPVTPAIFPPSTPREQMGNDAMDILRNLNIKASPGTQALYQYFS